MKQSLKTLLTLVLVAVVFSVISGAVGGFSVGIDFGEDALTLRAPKNYTVAVKYDEFQSLELIEQAQTDSTVLSGGQNRRYAWGERENDALGTYSLCIARKIDPAILITTTDGRKILFNYESEDTTLAILDMLPDLLVERKTA